MNQSLNSVRSDEVVDVTRSRSLFWNIDRAALAADDIRSALLLAVNHSGDSNSTGAIAGSLLGAMHGVEALSGDLIGDVELRPLIVTLAGDLSMSSRVTKRA